MNASKKKNSYELFRNKMKESVQEYYGDEYEVSVKPVTKLNGVELYGISILKKGEKISPNIYLEEFFTRYEKGTSFSTVFRELIGIYEESMLQKPMSVDFFSDYEKVKSRLNIKLINVKFNEKLLKDVPHRIFNDLAIVCMVEIDRFCDSQGTILIHNNHICMWGIREETLLKDAMENAMRISKPSINKLTDVLMSMAGNFPDEDIRDEIEMISKEPNSMFLLSNTNHTCGASVITYPKLLEGIGESLGCDYYILPSSIHEVIILPKHICGPEDSINSMIRSINDTVLKPEEILSDHAYYYNRMDEELVEIA